MASLREQFFAGNGMGINPLIEASAEELDKRMRAMGSPWKIVSTPEEKAQSEAEYQKRMKAKADAKAKEKERIDMAWAKKDAFTNFMKANLPELLAKQYEIAMNASYDGREIKPIPLPDLTGDFAQDIEIAKNYMKQWFAVAEPWKTEA